MPDSPTCLPNDRFAFPRSYVAGLYVRREPGTFSFVDNLLTFVVGVPPNALCEVLFDARFVPWSSNRWTLDHLVVSATYTTIPGGVTAPLPFYIYWVVPPDKADPYIGVDAQFGAVYSEILLPSAPPGYWSPPSNL